MGTTSAGSPARWPSWNRPRSGTGPGCGLGPAAAGRWPERAAHWHVDVPQQVGLPEGFEAVDGDLLAHRWSIDG